MSASGCHVHIVKKRGGLITKFLAKCRCGWKGTETGKVKAGLQGEIHKGGGEIVRPVNRKRVKHHDEGREEGS